MAEHAVRYLERHMGMMRLFIGTPLPTVLSEGLADIVHKAVTGTGMRWAPLRQWHVTALFIGERTEQELGRISDAMERCASDHAPFVLRDGRLAAMPEDRPTMLWVRFPSSSALTRLHHALAAATATTPAPYDPYLPHVTLARGGRPSWTGAPVVLPEVRIDRITLFYSRPGPDGNMHSPIVSTMLTGTAPTAPGEDA